jgi:hypothetical protein
VVPAGALRCEKRSAYFGTRDTFGKPRRCDEQARVLVEQGNTSVVVAFVVIIEKALSLTAIAGING